MDFIDEDNPFIVVDTPFLVLLGLLEPEDIGLELLDFELVLVLIVDPFTLGFFVVFAFEDFFDFTDELDRDLLAFVAAVVVLYFRDDDAITNNNSL